MGSRCSKVGIGNGTAMLWWPVDYMAVKAETCYRDVASVLQYLVYVSWKRDPPHGGLLGGSWHNWPSLHVMELECLDD